MYHCVCRPHDTKTFSPLAELLPNHTLPEFLFLETKWASLMSYGMTAKLLQDVLPIEEPINTFIIRQHIADVAERLEQELGDEQFCFVEGCQRIWDELPSPNGPITVGIDGGYVRGQRKQGQFEVIAGKSLLAFKRDQEGKQQLSGRCFAWVQTYDEKPKRRLFELLQSQGMQPNQQVDFLSDESGRFRGVWRLRLMRAATVRPPDLSLHSRMGASLRTQIPRNLPLSNTHPKFPFRNHFYWANFCR